MRAFSEADANAAAAMLQHWYGIATFLRCPFQPEGLSLRVRAYDG